MAQLVLERIVTPEVEEVEELEDTSASSFLLFCLRLRPLTSVYARSTSHAGSEELVASVRLAYRAASNDQRRPHHSDRAAASASTAADCKFMEPLCKFIE